MDVGLAPAIVCRVTYTGDLGYEIYVAPRYQLALFDALRDAGQDLGLRPFGMRAMMSLRLEKSFGAWLREYRPDYTAAETGLDRFIRFAKNDFIGRDAAMAERDKPPDRTLCTFVVEADDADVWADEPVWHDDKVVGFVTSGGYAHYVEKSVALGLLPRTLANVDYPFEIEILGRRCPARLIGEPLLDAQGTRMRS
jgi:dimethylglycine dehydrogenase